MKEGETTEARIVAEVRAVLEAARTKAADAVREALSQSNFDSAHHWIDEAKAVQVIAQRIESALTGEAPPESPPPELPRAEAKANGLHKENGPALGPIPQPVPEPVPAPIPKAPPEPEPSSPAPIEEPPPPLTDPPAPIQEPPAPVAVAKREKPKPAPKPKPVGPPTFDRAELASLLKSATIVELRPPNDTIERLERRGLVLAARGFLAEAKPEAQDHYRKEVEILRASNDEQFYAYNWSRSWPAEVWFELAEAYRAIAAAQRLARDASPMFQGAAKDEAEAAEIAALVYTEGVLRAAEPPAADHDLRQRLDELSPTHAGQAALFRPKAEDPVKRGELVFMGRRIYEVAGKVTRADKRGKEIMAALQSLESLLKEGGNFAEELPRRVEAVLDLGIPPTDQRLNALLNGLDDWLEEAPGKKMASLRTSLRTFRRGTRVVQLDPGPELSDAEYEQKRDEVRALTRGKVLGLVGGKKGQTERQSEIIAELELSELIWPDVEDATNVNLIYPKMRRADFVALIVRFSRHAYQNVIWDARQEGKGTFLITAGLNPRAIVNNMHAQLARSGPAVL